MGSKPWGHRLEEPPSLTPALHPQRETHPSLPPTSDSGWDIWGLKAMAILVPPCPPPVSKLPSTPPLQVLPGLCGPGAAVFTREEDHLQVTCP